MCWFSIPAPRCLSLTPRCLLSVNTDLSASSCRCSPLCQHHTLNCLISVLQLLHWFCQLLIKILCHSSFNRHWQLWAWAVWRLCHHLNTLYYSKFWVCPHYDCSIFLCSFHPKKNYILCSHICAEFSRHNARRFSCVLCLRLIFLCSFVRWYVEVCFLLSFGDKLSEELISQPDSTHIMYECLSPFINHYCTALLLFTHTMVALFLRKASSRVIRLVLHNTSFPVCLLYIWRIWKCFVDPILRPFLQLQSIGSAKNLKVFLWRTLLPSEFTITTNLSCQFTFSQNCLRLKPSIWSSKPISLKNILHNKVYYRAYSSVLHRCTKIMCLSWFHLFAESSVHCTEYQFVCSFSFAAH